MKEASGELNMTLVTVVAIAAIMGFAMIFVPKILNSVNNKWENVDNEVIDVNHTT